MSDRKVVIVSAVRTPIGSFCGSLSTLKAHELGAVTIKEAITRANVQPNQVSQVIIGQVLTAGQGQNPARQASIAAGLPIEVPAYCVNMMCGSGLKSVALGYQAIQCKDADIVVCGGQESMSQAPHCVNMRSGLKMGDGTFADTLLCDGLVDIFNKVHMGETAENIARKYSISRGEQDTFAAESQKKSKVAHEEGRFKKEIVSVTVPGRKGPTVVDTDEFPRPDTTADGLGKLRPAFVKENGTVTAGNSSGINDGAAMVVLMTRAEAERHCDTVPLFEIVSFAECGVEPLLMGMGPVPAVTEALRKANWRKEDVDLFELNEAFAAQSLAVIRELKLDPSKVNIYGGGISLGHPVGSSGTRILVTLLNALQQTGGKRGVASLCIGGGMGIALCVERI